MFHIGPYQNITIFFSKIKFDKNSYNLYNQILSGRKNLNDYVLILFICQAAIQVGFTGFFNELFDDVNNRKTIYYKQILSNFKSAYLYKENICSKLYYKIKGQRSSREIVFHRFYGELCINDYIWTLFENNSYRENFVTICNEILTQKVHNTKIDKIVPIN